MQKIVTVITCTFNEQDKISKAIKSIQNQTYKNIFHVIIDDGSTDNTIKIVKSFCEKYNNIKLLKSPLINLGAAMIRNYAINQIDTDYLAILDADDYCEPSRIEKQVKYLEKNEDVGILGSNCFIETNNKITVLKLPHTNDDIKNNIFKLNPFVLSSTMFRDTAWKKLNGFKKTTYGNSDADMWFRAVELNIKMHNLQDNLVTYKAKLFLPYLHIHHAIKIKLQYAIKWKKYYLIPYLMILYIYTISRNLSINIKNRKK